MPFKIIRNDITKIRADAIVNTANPDVAIGAGVDYAVYQAAGAKQLLAARRKIGYLAPGEVGITPAFGLPAKYIIHSSGPRFRDGRHGEPKMLRSCYEKSLRLAAEYGCASIAFPLMATGAYGFPEELGLQIAVGAFTDFLMDHEMEITLAVFADSAYKVSGKLFENVEAYIDDSYVCAETRVRSPERRGGWEKEESTAVFWTGELPDVSRVRFQKPDRMPEKAAARSREVQTAGALEPRVAKPSEASLDEQLKAMYTDSFAKHLQQLINKKGMKNSEVYAAANISKQYFSKLLKGEVHPSKEKMLALAVGLRLNMDEAVDFLKLAGYAFSPVSQTDVIVGYFLRKKDYSVIKIDIVLFDYGLSGLS